MGAYSRILFYTFTYLLVLLVITGRLGIDDARAYYPEVYTGSDAPASLSPQASFNVTDADRMRVEKVMTLLQAAGLAFNGGGGDGVAGTLNQQICSETLGMMPMGGAGGESGLKVPGLTASAPGRFVSSQFDNGARQALSMACTSLTSKSTSTLDPAQLMADFRRAGMLAAADAGLQMARGTGLPFLSRLELETGLRMDNPYWTVLSVQPLWQDKAGQQHVFVQTSWNRHDEGKDTVNGGIAYRRLLADDTAMIGLNAFFDHNLDANHNRFSIGVDGQTSLLGFSANRYIPLTGWKSASLTEEERAVSGWDMELRGQLAQMPAWTAYLRGYQWDGLDGESDIYGVDSRLEWAPSQAMRVYGGAVKENHKALDMQFGLRFILNHAEGGLDGLTQPVRLASVKDRVYEKVRRENIIRVQTRRKKAADVQVVQTVGANTVISAGVTSGIVNGQTIEMPTRVTVGNTAGAVLRLQFHDGAILTLGQDTVVDMNPAELTLVQGIMQYVSGSVNRTVNVPGGTIELLGTDIDVRSRGGDATVRVREGRVRVNGSLVVPADLMASVSTTSLVAEGTPQFAEHKDEASTQIDRIAAPQSGGHIAPYPFELPRIVTPATSIGDTIVFGVRYTRMLSISGGTPQLQINIGGVERQAALTDSTTADLQFSYTLMPADSGASDVIIQGIDRNGATMTADGNAAVVTFASTPVALGGTVTDTTAPSGYSAAFDADDYDYATRTAAAFTISDAEIGTTYEYSITSSAGGANVTGTGNVTAASMAVSGIDLSAMTDGALTLSLTLTDAANNIGAAVTDTATLLAGASLSMDFMNDAFGLNGASQPSLTALMSAAGGTFSRGSVGTYFDSAGVMQTAAAGVPRIDHVPFTGARRGLLIEEARTNRILHSNDVTRTPMWQLQGTALTSAGTTTAPDGSTVPVYNFSTSTVVFQDVSATPGRVMTHSIWIRGNRNATLGFRLPGSANNEANNRNIAVTTSWQRFTLTSTVAAGMTTSRLLVDNRFTQVPGLQLSFFGAQIEEGAFATSFIPTTTASATRAEDTLTFSDAGGWLAPDTGTLVAQGSMYGLGRSAFPGFASLDDGTANNALQMIVDDTTDNIRTHVYNAGTNVYAYAGPTYVAGAAVRLAMAYTSTSVRTAYNGTLQTAGTVAVPAFNRLNVGRRRGALDPLDGWIQRIDYYKNNRTNADLVPLTQ